MLPTRDRVEPNLVALIDTLPSGEHYSYSRFGPHSGPINEPERSNGQRPASILMFVASYNHAFGGCFMRQSIGIALLCLLPLSTVAAQSPPPSADEAAVRTIVAKYVNARELHDPALIEALFTADADQHTTSGEWRRGRAQVVQGTLASSKQNPGSRTIRVESVRFVTPDVALADGPYEIATAGAVRKMWTTITLKREREGWRIAAIRNMLPTAQ